MNPEFIADKAGLYSIQITNEYYCVGTDSILLEERCPAEYFFPNIFSPNGDGINDFEVGTATMTGTCRSGYFMIFKGDTSVTTGIDEQPIQLADDFELYEPYPNPFNPNVTIAFKISKSSSITLTLYDILGKEIKQIIKNQQREAGKYEEVINTSELSLSSGVYVIQLQAVSDNKIIFSSSKKLNLIK